MMKGERLRIGVVGGGILGLTIAYELVKQGKEVVVYEAHQLGGLASGFQFPGLNDVYLESFYHHIFTTDNHILSLIKELNLSERLLYKDSTVGIFLNDTIYPFVTPIDLIKFKPLGSILQRLLFGLNSVYLSSTKNWKKLDAVTVKDFYGKRGNELAYTKIWKPLLRAKFGNAYESISTAFLWGRIRARFSSRYGQKEILCYLKGGFQHLIFALVDAIKQKKGEIKTNVTVEAICPGKTPRIITNTSKEDFDYVISTVNYDLFSGIEVFSKIQYMGIVCLVLTMKRRQGNIYWLNICDDGVPFSGIIEHTNLVDSKDYNNNYVLYVFSYVPQNHEYFYRTADQILGIYEPYLMKIFKNFRMKDIENRYIFKENYATPVYDIHYLHKIPPHFGFSTNVALCCMAQLYPYDRNLNNSISLVENFLRTLFYKK